MRPRRRAAAGILPRVLGASGRPKPASASVVPPHRPRRAAVGRSPMTTPNPRTEEELRAITVGELTTLTGPIPFVEHDARWPEIYDREATRIRAALGDRVLRIEHHGSASVPGLAAKPIIDITMTVADVTDEPAFAPDLEAVGYRPVLREGGPEWGAP